MGLVTPTFPAEDARDELPIRESGLRSVCRYGFDKCRRSLSASTPTRRGLLKVPTVEANHAGAERAATGVEHIHPTRCQRPASGEPPTDGTLATRKCGEDAVLLRVFGDQPTGCWVDVGANHPVHDSVTKNFMDLGWSGVNIEPVDALHALLNEMRPHDTNVLAGVSDHVGEMTFYRVDSNFGLSTFQADLATGYRAAGESVTDFPVAITTLAAVCERYLDGRSIDFMKIDVEGHELSVLKGHDFERFPARVLLAETGDRHDEIIEFVMSRGMRFMQFDGLNCSFVAADESDDFARAVAVAGASGSRRIPPSRLHRHARRPTRSADCASSSARRVGDWRSFGRRTSCSRPIPPSPCAAGSDASNQAPNDLTSTQPGHHCTRAASIGKCVRSNVPVFDWCRQQWNPGSDLSPRAESPPSSCYSSS